jgi:hypothetical protein
MLWPVNIAQYENCYVFQNVIEGMEKHWLGCWKGLLVGQTSDQGYNTALQDAAATLSKLARKHLRCKCTVAQAKVSASPAKLIFITMFYI